MLNQLKNRNPEGLAELIRQYNSYVTSIITLILGQRGSGQDVEELVSDVFFAIWTHTDRLSPGKVKAYIGATARNTAKSFLRKNKELPMDIDEINLPSEATPESEFLQRELESLVQEAVDCMREPDREIFIRYYYYLQTTREIGSAMNMKPGTVRIHLMRGRNALKKSLNKEDVLWV